MGHKEGEKRRSPERSKKRERISPEGILRFEPVQKSLVPPPFPQELAAFRNFLRKEGFVGNYPDGIGYGNLGMVQKDGSMILTATQTQTIEELDESGFVRIREDDIIKIMQDIHSGLDVIEVPYEGSQKPSSESLTLIAIAQAREGVKAVVHVHFYPGWYFAMKEHLISLTAGKYKYGTRGFALEAEEVVKKIDMDYGSFATPLHDDGLFFYGRTIEEACDLAVDYCGQFLWPENPREDLSANPPA